MSQRQYLRQFECQSNTDYLKEQENAIKQRIQPKAKPIKKKNKHRQITHYFNKIDKIFCVNNKIPLPDKQVESIQNQLMDLCEVQQKQLEKLRQLTQRRDNLKVQNEGLMQTIKHQTQLQLKKISQINRFFISQLKCTIVQQQIQIKQTSEKIKQLSIALTGSLPSTQRFFLNKQLNQEKNKLQIRQQEYKHQFQRYKLFQQQQNSILSKQKWPLISKRYLPLQLIGKGGFSQVYKGYDIDSGRLIALKLSSVEQLLSDCGDKYSYLKHIKRQYKIHSELNHKNIVKLIEVLQLQNMLCIVLEYCQGATLAQMMTKWGRFMQEQMKQIVKQIADVIWYLSRQHPPVVHYDLKPQNIIFHNGQLKILDFGISKVLDNQHSKMSLTSGGLGTYYYLPPQVLLSGHPTLSSKADIWSLGVIGYELLYGRKPFQGQDINNPSAQLIFDEQRHVSANCRAFVRNCLQLKENDRLSPTQAINHMFFLQ